MDKKKILIIDDDPDILESTRVVLGSHGYEVFSAKNINDGLKSVKKILPDLVIMDVMLDKMCDGFDLTRNLKSDKKYKDIPILMLTSVGETTGFRYCPDAGDKEWLPVDDYVEKPITSKELISKVEKLLGMAT